MVCFFEILGVKTPPCFWTSAVNIDLLNRDMHDESWGQSLSCELDNELRLVETGTGLSFYRMSEGQRKRMQLALFFATFEVAQNRSAFQPRILFLDEVFDALDQDGQIAVQRWITHYAETHENGKIFVVSHSATTEGLAKNIAGRILVCRPLPHHPRRLPLRVLLLHGQEGTAPRHQRYLDHRRRCEEDLNHRCLRRPQYHSPYQRM